MRPMLSLDIAPDGKAATIYVRSRTMKRFWRRQALPPVTKMNFLTHCWLDLPEDLRQLLRDVLNKGCATSLKRLRFKKAIRLELCPYSTTKELFHTWKQHTGEELFDPETYGSSPIPGRYVGMSWRPTR